MRVLPKIRRKAIISNRFADIRTHPREKAPGGKGLDSRSFL